VVDPPTGAEIGEDTAVGESIAMPNTGGVGGRDVGCGLGGGSTAVGGGGSTIASFCLTGRAARGCGVGFGIALAGSGSRSATAGFGGSGATGFGRRNSTSIGRDRMRGLP